MDQIKFLLVNSFGNESSVNSLVAQADEVEKQIRLLEQKGKSLRKINAIRSMDELYAVLNPTSLDTTSVGNFTNEILNLHKEDLKSTAEIDSILQNLKGKTSLNPFSEDSKIIGRIRRYDPDFGVVVR